MANVLYKHAKENRKRFVGMLESNDYKQITDSYAGPDGSKCFCALGLALYEVLGYTDADFDADYNADPSVTETLAEQMQIDEDHALEIVYLNDGTHFNFNDIAKSLVERGFLEKGDYDMSPEFKDELDRPNGGVSRYSYMSLG